MNFATRLLFKNGVIVGYGWWFTTSTTCKD